MTANNDDGLTDDDIDPPRISTGSNGLDDILGGGSDADGFISTRAALDQVRHTPAMQLLMDGARRGERTLYISLSKNRRELACCQAAWMVAERD